MRNKIPCSAERLGLLDPQMIQAVSEASAFQIGHQYLTENRVRIVEADDAQISSAVIGNSGLYEQTIRLRDGHLISKCSCTLPEEPMCRHCIAVLLEYHRWAQPRQSRKTNDTRETKAQPQAEHAADGRTSTMQSSAPDVKLSEVMQFVEWLQPAMKAIEKGERVPEPPKLGAGEVSMWIQTIRNLEDRRRESEEVQVSLESEMRDREAYVARLTQQLQTSIAEAKTAQAASQELQRVVTTCKGMLAKFGELAGEVARYDGQMRSVANEILSKSTQLDKLAGSFKELADALKSATKQTPSQ
ncbi:MAG: hypothetical protein EWM72_03214 [Nitrospira sp.]|nr:MAG: hypothetical protein EWM72_03214 [Nitrospira sp.]